MTRDETPPRQDDLFLQNRARVGTEASALNDDVALDPDLDPDLDELVDRLIDAPEFAEARQITEALGIDPDAAPGSGRSRSGRATQHDVRDVDGKLQEIDFDLADLLARASDELEQRPARSVETGTKAAPALRAGDPAAAPDGFSADGFEPDPAHLDSFQAPSRPRTVTRPRLSLVGADRPGRDAGSEGQRVDTPSSVAAPAEAPVAVSPVAELRTRAQPSEARRPGDAISRGEVSDAPRAGSMGRPSGSQPSERDIGELWQETSRLERRFAAAQDLRDSLGRGAPTVSRCANLSAPPSPHPRFPDSRATGGFGQWRRRLLSWMAAGMIAAAIIAAGQLGLLDPARAWLHQQLGMATTAVGNTGEPATVPLLPQAVDGGR